MKGCVCFVGSASCRAFGHTRPASVPGWMWGCRPHPAWGYAPNPIFKNYLGFSTVCSPRLHKQPGVVLYPSVFLIPKNNLKKPASILGVLQTTIFIICTSLSAKEHQPYSQCNEQQWQYNKQCFGWHTGNTYKNTGKTEYERRKFWTSRSVPSHHKNTSRQLKLLHFIPQGDILLLISWRS